MTTQMTEMQHEVDDKQKMETALQKAEQARKEVIHQAVELLAICLADNFALPSHRCKLHVSVAAAGSAYSECT